MGRNNYEYICNILLYFKGDPRRPFPQDIEMRAGILGRLSSGGALDEASETTSIKAEQGQFGIVGKQGIIGSIFSNINARARQVDAKRGRMIL